jgi:hypothetical protein
MAKVTVEFNRAEVKVGGGYLFQTADGQQFEFETIEEIRSFCSPVETAENAIRFGLSRLLFQEPNLTPNAQGKLAYLLGKAVDLEMEAADQVVIR